MEGDMPKCHPVGAMSPDAEDRGWHLRIDGHVTVVYVLIRATWKEGNIQWKCCLQNHNIENVTQLSTNQNPECSHEVWDNIMKAIYIIEKAIYEVI